MEKKIVVPVGKVVHRKKSEYAVLLCLKSSADPPVPSPDNTYIRLIGAGKKERPKDRTRSLGPRHFLLCQPESVPLAGEDAQVQTRGAQPSIVTSCHSSVDNMFVEENCSSASESRKMDHHYVKSIW
jgi:hypothetical protein